ncbi:MAG: MBL fold metallo-hydrolase [Bacteroidales bacterium]|nr:MBL fold metallo-hydrolase [Bacteroidales bacterium]
MIRFQSFSSGSCGNCYLLAYEQDGRISAGVLIDAGVSLRRLKKELASEGLSTDDFDNILVTHDHMDHIRNLGSLCKYLHKPVWASRQLLHALSHNTFTLDHIGAVKKELKEDSWNEIVPGMLSVRYFTVPHDATHTVGYAIRLNGYDFVIMTDIGRMTDEALELASKAGTVVIESNYDMDMLMGGPYPHELKMRICQGSGHLSNEQCAEAVRKFWHKGLKHLFLCHLSEHNNTPRKAIECTAEVLKDLGADAGTSLVALPRQTPSQLYILEQ